jgi:hypothetical protein
MGWDSAITAQKYIRRFIARCKFLRWRPHMKRISALWRRLYKAGIGYFYASHAKVIQRFFKQVLFINKRIRSAAFINRLGRGHLGRNIMRAKIHAIHTALAIKIQRAWRECQRRRHQHFIHCRNHIAARRIQVIFICQKAKARCRRFFNGCSFVRWQQRSVSSTSRKNVSPLPKRPRSWRGNLRSSKIYSRKNDSRYGLHMLPARK